ncbi:mechanosensitive ion channel family protein [Halospeciosus flavus]|uniref:Mechanosensitive ion channel family protein n=1 Tax=Halospeciosus flavus TaxID=3032283 RepID=A0ABD5Z5C1_9EURY|nr:mechanosensitive ion channel family protein [Halospeciosus flavus]
MTRGYLSILVALVCAVLAAVSASATLPGPIVYGFTPSELTSKALAGVAVVLAAYGTYVLVTGLALSRTMDKRRRHKVQSVLQLVFVVLATVGVLGVFTQQWVPALVSLGVVGFAATFALQQPLLSLFGWVYIMTKQPYEVGDRIAIEGNKGDVVDVDFLVTTLWEINGELVSSNQPSGRHVTVPNSAVLSANVVNFSRDEFPYVWNEISFQVAYETDLEFTKELFRETAAEYLGDEMAAAVERYREQLEETPVELEVNERPSVNVKQEESWVELRLRYLTRPRRGQQVKNELYARVLDRANEHPEQVKFPVSRNR